MTTEALVDTAWLAARLDAPDIRIVQNCARSAVVCSPGSIPWWSRLTETASTT